MRTLVGVLLLMMALTGDAFSERANTLTVTLTPTPDGLRADYVFARPVSHTALQLGDPAAPNAHISVATRGLTLLQGGGVTGASPFRRMSLLITPDTARADATYPVLVNVGAGRLLYAPVLADTAAYTVRYRAAQGLQLTGSQSGDGFLFVGPAAQIHSDGGLIFITAAATPSSVSHWFAAESQNLLAFYSQKLGRGPADPATVILDYRQSEQTDFAGDVTPHGMLLLQVTARSEQDAQTVRESAFHLLAHEFFHLWNGNVDYNEADGNGHWIHEGAAEYAAHLATHVLHPEWDGLAQALAADYSPCANTLGDSSLVGLADARAESTRYSCGLYAYWILDLTLRHQSPPSDVFSVWRQLFGAGVNRPYNYADVRAATAGLPADNPYALLVEGRGADRWRDIIAALKAYGVDAQFSSDVADAYREASAYTLMRAACTPQANGHMGFSARMNGTALTLDDNPSCGELAGGPRLIAVDGVNTDTGAWADVYRAIVADCATRGAIHLHVARSDGEHDVDVVCRVAPVTPPMRVIISDPWPER
jgi:hypothetical protein